MDADEEYVEYDDNVDDESPLSRKPEAKQFPQVKRYKDDTYRCLLCATSYYTVVACNVRRLQCYGCISNNSLLFAHPIDSDESADDLCIPGTCKSGATALSCC